MDDEELQTVTRTAAELQERVRQREQESSASADDDDTEPPRVDTGYVVGVRERNRFGKNYELVVEYGGSDLTVPFDEHELQDPTSEINGLLRLNNVKPTNIAELGGSDVVVFDGTQVAVPKSGVLTDRLRHRWLRLLARHGVVPSPSKVSDRYTFYHGSIHETIFVYATLSLLTVLMGTSYALCAFLGVVIAGAGGLGALLAGIISSAFLGTLMTAAFSPILGDVVQSSDTVSQAILTPVNWAKRAVGRLNRRL